jgi:hypothetical protein
MNTHEMLGVESEELSANDGNHFCTIGNATIKPARQHKPTAFT